ncbi:MAG: UDP-2,3-diacylglucosamine diphosphatase LpxI [Candidatus Brocadiia bacterium]
MSQAPETIGILCGAGDLPLQVARSLRRRGARVVAVGIKGEADAGIESCADQMHWTGLAKLGRWVRLFKAADVNVVLMLGAIRKQRMFGNLAALVPDWRSVKLWYSRLGSREDHTILEAVVEEFEREGLRVGSVLDYCPGLLAERGPLTRREPDEAQWRDIRFGWPLAKQIAALQIGQCIVVRDGAVVAVEGIDGTDATLERGGRLAGGGAVAIKVQKHGHDLRFDIPCVGPDTVRTMADAGVAVLALEAGGTLVLDREQVRDLAEQAGVSLVAVAEEDVKQ